MNLYRLYMDRELQEWNRRLDALTVLSRKNKWAKLLRLPYKLPKSFLLRKMKVERKECVNTFMDVPLELPFPEANDIYLFGSKVHDSELRLTRFLLNQKNAIKVFFDVGAHVGFYATLMAKRFPEASVFAFEPSSVFSSLKQNTSAFSNVKIINSAVGERTEKLEFFEYDLGNKEYNSLILDESKDLKYSIRKVDCVSLDAFVSEQNVNPDLIKIDVEGGELGVLKGMIELLVDAKVKIILEIIKNSNSGVYVSLFKLLNEYKYLANQIDDFGGLKEIKGLSDLGTESENIVFIPKELKV